MNRSARCLLAALSMVLAPACGTTVDQGALATGSASARPGLGLGDGSAPAVGVEQEAPGAPADAGVGITSGSDPSQPDGPDVAGAPPAPAAATGTEPQDVQGSSAPRRPIQVGIPYPGGADEANAAAGSNATTGDPQRQWKILVDELNKRGGIAGHRVLPVFFEIDANGDFAAQAQAACSHFTEDNRVVAVLGSGINFTPRSFYDCLDRAGVAVVDGGGSADRQDLAQLRRLLIANGMTLDRATASTVDGLAAQGWLADGSRIGVVTYDVPSFRRVVSNTLKPELARHGAAVAEEQYVAFPQSTAGLGQIAAQTSNAVLRFNSRGINRVLFLEVGGEIALFFMQAAESQAYRPQYGLNSTDGGQVLADNVPKGQLEGSLGIGWLPAVDVAAAADPRAQSPARQRCLQIFKDQGVTFSSTNALLIGTGQCDLVRVLELAGARARDLTGNGIATGATALGRSFDSAVTFSTMFSPDRRDAAASYRPTAFTESCGCFRYTGAERPSR